MFIADVYINLPVKSIAQAYSYIIPEDKLFLDVGWRVIVPFHGRATEGFILNKYEVDKTERPLKYIDSVLDDEPWFTHEIIHVAKSLASFYLCSLAEIMRLFMPGKSGAKISLVYEVLPQNLKPECSEADIEYQIYQYLQINGPSSKNKLKKLFPINRFDYILDKMCKQKKIRKRYNIDKKASVRIDKYIQLKAPLTDEIIRNNFKRKPAQQKLLLLLNEIGTVSAKSIHEKGVSSGTIKALLDTSYIEIIEKRIMRDSYQNFRIDEVAPVELTAYQKNIINSVQPFIDAKRYYFALLHGVTGSGKTQVYVELTKAVRKTGRQVIILVPEIALTGQIVQVFKQNFSEDIVVIHSQLSTSERNDSFVRFRHGDVGIAIGARSALFVTPMDLGLIVIDEEQDPSYKQDEAPRYHTRIVAEMLAKTYHCSLILGSATPSLEAYYQAKQGRIHLFTMPERIGAKTLPVVRTVDMRNELKQGNRKILSNDMMRLIRDTIQQKQQISVMLNRRGFSTFVMCRECGYVMKCPECGIPLVYHKANHLMCHHCDIRLPVPSVCPECSSTYIKYFGSGTEKLEAELAELVPQARIIRLDRDTTQKKFSQTEILRDFRKGKYDILLGTQMVAKGHDIPNVTAAGIISADASLNLPDFRSAERCFMLIAQTAGRSGRGDVPGKVLVQCYNPEHYSVKTACEQNYEAFYEQEIQLRQVLYFPPYCRLIKLTFLGESEAGTKVKAEQFKMQFISYFTGRKEQQIIGPAADTVAYFRGKYRFNILIKAGKFVDVLEFFRKLRLHEDNEVLIDIDPISI